MHPPSYIFSSLKNRKLPIEHAHDVYCSGCGNLTHCRSRDKAEGGAPTIEEAGVRISAWFNRASFTYTAFVQRLPKIKYADDDIAGSWFKFWVYEEPKCTSQNFDVSVYFLEVVLLLLRLRCRHNKENKPRLGLSQPWLQRAIAVPDI